MGGHCAKALKLKYLKNLISGVLRGLAHPPYPEPFWKKNAHSKNITNQKSVRAPEHRVRASVRVMYTVCVSVCARQGA